MKKLFLFAAAIALQGMLFAALPGDKPGETRHKLSWIDCSPAPLGKIDAEKHKNIPACRAVVFMYTRAQDSNRTFVMLENLRRQYYKKLLVIAITPDQVSDAETFRKRHPDARVRMAVDQSRRLTPEFMKGTIMLFPMAFLMDADGMILWRGEAVDLPEIFERYQAGKLDLNTQKKCDPLVYKMQQAMRDGNMFKCRDAAAELLKVDPANPSALRMLVFAYETLGNPGAAWKAVQELTKKVPGLPRLYFTALDLIVRHSTLRAEWPGLIRNFGKQPFVPAVRCAFADALLSSFQFESAAVLGAKEILAATPMALSAQAEQMAHLLAVRARLNYALGNLDSAEADMAEAVQLFKSSADKNMLMRAQKQLQFFRAIIADKKESAR